MGDFMPIIAKNHTSLLKKKWLEKKVIMKFLGLVS